MSNTTLQASPPRAVLDREVVSATVTLIATVVRHIQLKRALSEIDPNPELTFWRLIYGGLMDLVVIDWCKLFGSDDEAKQPSHWKNIVPETGHDGFRKGLLAHLNITWEQWTKYREHIVYVRNNYTAHFSPPWLQPTNTAGPSDDDKYPGLDFALEATCYYYSRLLAQLNSSGYAHNYPEDLKTDYLPLFIVQTREAASKAIGATNGMVDRII